MKAKSATIPFFSFPPFLPLASTCPFPFFFSSVFFEVIGQKTLFHSNGCKLWYILVYYGPLYVCESQNGNPRRVNFDYETLQ